MNSKSIHISLMEPVVLLKNLYRDYVIARTQSSRNPEALPFKSLSFDHVPFMTAIVEEMFEAAAVNKMVDFGHTPKSTLLLMEAGLDRDTAAYVASQVFGSMVGSISPFLPEASFLNVEGYQYGFCNDYDLMVRPPEKYQITTLEEEL